MISVNARIVREEDNQEEDNQEEDNQEEDNQEEDIYNPPWRVLLALVIFICNSAGSVNVQAFAANS